MEQLFNDKDKERFIKPSSNNDNVPIEAESSTSFQAAHRAEDIADSLARKFPATNGADPAISRLFFLKVAYRLDRDTISRLVTNAQEKGRGNGGQLFNWLARKEMLTSKASDH